MAGAEQGAACAQCQSSGQGGLSHHQNQRKDFHRHTFLSRCEPFVIELWVALHATSWKLFERFPLFSDHKKKKKRAVFKAQSNSWMFSGQPKPPVTVSWGEQKGERGEPAQMHSSQNSLRLGETTEQSSGLCLAYRLLPHSNILYLLHTLNIIFIRSFSRLTNSLRRKTLLSTEKHRRVLGGNTRSLQIAEAHYLHAGSWWHCCLSSSLLVEDTAGCLTNSVHQSQRWTRRPPQCSGGTRNRRKSNSVYHYNTQAESSIPGSSLCMDASPK